MKRDDAQRMVIDEETPRAQQGYVQVWKWWAASKTHDLKAANAIIRLSVTAMMTCSVLCISERFDPYKDVRTSFSNFHHRRFQELEKSVNIQIPRASVFYRMVWCGAILPPMRLSPTHPI